MSTREEQALELIERVRARPPRFRDTQITMAHGAGGKATWALIQGLLAPALGLETLADAAAVDGLALTTDSFVVKPLRFPGGSIGELAVNGTVNDLAVAGARPIALTLSLVLEEGLPAGLPALHRAHRQRAKDPDFQSTYRTHRPMVERSIAWLVRGNRRVPYRGVEKNNTWLHHRRKGH